jgi:hypothetical protein
MTYWEFYGGLDFDLTKGTASGSHSNAVGLRLYYDAISRPSRFGMEIAPNPMRDYFLHLDSSGDFLSNPSPTATDTKYKDSPSGNRTAYKEIGTWSLKIQRIKAPFRAPLFFYR